ncbi:MAG: gliding motility-associated C-terminal domain-containing protein, partial [Chitinophagales bacterium]
WPTLPAEHDSIANSIPAGTYNAYVQDANGCRDTVTAIITEPTKVGAAITHLDSVSCFGGNNGGITLAPHGGVSPYTQSVDAGPFNAVAAVSGLTAGPHSITIRDAHNCDTIINFNIYQPVLLTPSIITSRNASCHGGCDAMVRAAGNGGTTPYQYAIDGGSNQLIDSFNSLCAGSHTITITDAKGCDTTISITITEPAILVLDSVTTTQPLCNASQDGSLTVSASGGTPGYQYGIPGRPYQSSGLFTGLYGGVYSAVVKDANGCIDSLHITVPAPPATATLDTDVVDVNCYGQSNGSINLTVNGSITPYTFDWADVPGTNNTEDRTNIPAGHYFVHVVDANGCPVGGLDTIIVNQPSHVGASIAHLDSISCNGLSDGGITMAPSGGVPPYTQSVDAGGFNPIAAVTGLAAGPHNITIRDAHNCDTIVNFTIYTPPALQATETHTNVSCNAACDGQAVIAATGGTRPYSYSIDAGTPQSNDTFKLICAGAHNVVVTDAHNCVFQITVTITQPAVLVLDTVSVTPPTCNASHDAGFTLTASGGTTNYNYAIRGGNYQPSPTFSGLLGGNYTAVVKDAHNCVDSFVFFIPTPPVSTTLDTNVINVSCFGGTDGSIDLIVNGTATPYSYDWDDVAGTSNSEDRSNLTIGAYYVHVKDANGCPIAGLDTIKITQPNAITISETHTNPSCKSYGDACINLTVSGGTPAYAFDWGNGHMFEDTCGLTAGSYTVTVTDAHNCQKSIPAIVINDPPGVTVTNDSIRLVSCPGLSDGGAFISASGGTGTITYLWSNAAVTEDLTGVPVGTYYVTITDSKGCQIIDTAIVDVVPPMNLNAAQKNVLCPPLKNGAASISVSGGTPGYSVIWSNGFTGNAIYGLAEGTYSVTINDARGCVRDTTFTIGNDSIYHITAQPHYSEIDLGESVNLQAIDNGPGIASITWSPVIALTCSDCPDPTASPVRTIRYTVVAISDSGCVSSDTAFIRVIPDYQIYVPNAFTPNGDGNNDYWEIYGANQKKSWSLVNVTVFNRWGEKMFESNDINFKWDGTFKGVPQEPNVYVYQVKVTFTDGYTERTLKGSVTLLR